MKKHINKQIALTGVFSALIIVLSLSLSALSYTSKGVICTLLATIIGHFFDKSKILYWLSSCVIIVLILTALQGIWIGINLYFPMIILSFVFMFTLKTSKVKYYLITTPLIALVSVMRTYIYTIFFNISINEYVYNAVEKLKNYSSIEIIKNPSRYTLIVLVITYFIGITFCQVFLCDKINSILKKKFYPILRRVIKDK